MNAGPLDMLHDARNQDVLAVADGVDLDFRPLHVMVDQNGTIRRRLYGIRQVMSQVAFIINDLHGSATQDVGRPHHYRITDAVGRSDGCAGIRHAGAFRPGNIEISQKFIEFFPVFGRIDRFQGSSHDLHTRAR